MTYLYFTIFLVVIYIGLIVIFTVGWRRIPNFQSRLIKKNDIKVSIVIACKNEEKNLPRLIQALRNQTYTDFELIIVNDHSTDRTQEILESQIAEFDEYKVLSAIKSGKKNAIAQGITEALGELIITTDADCFFEQEWVETIVNFYLQTNPDLVICPVKITENSSFFSKLQALEFTSLIASGAGIAGFGMPVMCNAANMAFSKKAWLDSKNDLHNEEPSGDDVFLLLSIKKRKGNILFLKSEKAMAYTQAKPTLTAFFNQRSRWAGKSKFYTDWQIISLGLIIFTVSLIQILSLFLSFIHIHFLLLYFLIFTIKFESDYLFLKEVNSFFKMKDLFKYAFILSLVYPLYVLIAFVKSLNTNKVVWK